MSEYFVFIPKKGLPQLWQTIPDLNKCSDDQYEQEMINMFVRVINEPLEEFLKNNPGTQIEMIAQVTR